MCLYVADEFTAMKAEGKLPYSQFPLAQFLTATGEEIVSVSQTKAILHAIGAMSIGTAKAIGSNDFKESAKIDELLDFHGDLFMALGISSYRTRFCLDAFKDDEALVAARGKIVEEYLKPKLAMLDKRILGNGSEWSAGTAAPSIADFMLCVALSQVTAGDKAGGKYASCMKTYRSRSRNEERKRERERGYSSCTIDIVCVYVCMCVYVCVYVLVCEMQSSDGSAFGLPDTHGSRRAILRAAGDRRVLR